MGELVMRRHDDCANVLARYQPCPSCRTGTHSRRLAVDKVLHIILYGGSLGIKERLSFLYVEFNHPLLRPALQIFQLNLGIQAFLSRPNQ